MVDAFFQGLTDSLMQGDRIEARGFGVWQVKRTEPRNAHNPKTGQPVYVPARKKATFKPGKILKEALSRPPEPPP